MMKGRWTMHSRVSGVFLVARAEGMVEEWEGDEEE